MTAPEAAATSDRAANALSRNAIQVDSLTVPAKVSTVKAGSWRRCTGVCSAGVSSAPWSSSMERCIAVNRSCKTAPCSLSTFLVTVGSRASSTSLMASRGTSRRRSRRMIAASVSWATEYDRYPVRGSMSAGTSSPVS